MSDFKKIEISAEQNAFLLQIQRRKQLIRLLQILFLIIFFLSWEIAASEKWIDPFIFSQPSKMLNYSKAMLTDGSLWPHVTTTLWETTAGFLLGTLLGTLTAVLLWWNPFLSSIADPYLVVLNAIPKTALAPIIIVWFGNFAR